MGEGGWADWTEDEEEADREEDGAKGNQTVVVVAHTQSLFKWSRQVMYLKQFALGVARLHG